VWLIVQAHPELCDCGQDKSRLVLSISIVKCKTYMNLEVLKAKLEQRSGKYLDLCLHHID